MNRLYQTIKKIKGTDYVYMGFGKKLKYIHPREEPSKTDERNIVQLLDYLDQGEQKDLSLYEEDRRKLVSFLSEAEQKKYLVKRTAELQTRLRSLGEFDEIRKTFIFLKSFIEQVLTYQDMDDFISSGAFASNLSQVDLDKLKKAKVLLKAIIPG